MRHRAVLVTVIAALLLAGVPPVSVDARPAAAGGIPAQAGVTTAAVSPEQAGDALAAATTVQTAKAALLTILTGGGIAVADGTGAPAGMARAQISPWVVDALAADHVAGASVSLARNAAELDRIIRGGGGPAVTAASLSTVLKQWIAAPADAQEGYLLRAIAEVGRRTVPAYDLAKGAPADSPLPLVLLVAEDVALAKASRSASKGTGQGLRAAGSSLVGSAVPGTPLAGAAGISEDGVCGNALTGVDLFDKAMNLVSGIDKVKGWYFQPIEGGTTVVSDIDQALSNFSSQLDQLEGLGEQAEAASYATVLALLNAMLQFALTEGLLQVDIAQTPRPQNKHEADAEPNEITVKITVKASKDMPHDAAQCVKWLTHGTVGVDLPKPGDPISKAHVQLSEGSPFFDNVKWDDDYYIRAGDPGRKNQYTDDSGALTVHLQTQPQKLPKTVQKSAVRDAVLRLEIGTQDLGPSLQGVITFLADKIAPWSTTYPVAVKQRVSNALTLSGHFDSNLLIAQIAGSLNLHSCDGYRGIFNGTFALSGDEVVVGGGSKSYHVGVAVPFDQPENAPDNEATPKLGVVTAILKTARGTFGIEFVDATTAELTVDGQPAVDSSGAPMIFTVTEGSDQCPGS